MFDNSPAVARKERSGVNDKMHVFLAVLVVCAGQQGQWCVGWTARGAVARQGAFVRKPAAADEAATTSSASIARRSRRALVLGLSCALLSDSPTPAC